MNGKLTIVQGMINFNALMVPNYVYELRTNEESTFTQMRIAQRANGIGAAADRNPIHSLFAHIQYPLAKIGKLFAFEHTQKKKEKDFQFFEKRTKCEI